MWHISQLVLIIIVIMVLLHTQHLTLILCLIFQCHLESVLVNIDLVNVGGADVKKLNSLAEKAVSDKWSMYSFKDGLGSFAEKSLEYILSRGVRVNLNQPCRNLSFKNGLALVR